MFLGIVGESIVGSWVALILGSYGGFEGRLFGTQILLGIGYDWPGFSWVPLVCVIRFGRLGGIGDGYWLMFGIRLVGYLLGSISAL